MSNVPLNIFVYVEKDFPPFQQIELEKALKFENLDLFLL